MSAIDLVRDDDEKPIPPMPISPTRLLETV
jgi:hypothetical protein